MGCSLDSLHCKFDTLDACIAPSIKRYAHCIKEGIEMEREGIHIERERFPVTFDVLIVYTAAVIINVAKLYICDKFNGNSILNQCYWHIIIICQ